ncbi:DUF3883 domain-containing protein [Williamsia maris]|uniref:DUF3883 domain-containing protein n=1 Tax=Williamsia maris TaxID=72806 RepID=UPI0020A307E7|nr:DUF3883 domain-containing protein [Williamsia maris]
MAEGSVWARWEVDVCVDEYFTILTLQMNGQSFNKSHRAKTLAHKLDGRSEKSVKNKYSNISAVMTMLGYPTVDGYSPRFNYQRILADAIRTRLMLDSALHESVLAAVQRPTVRADIVYNADLWIEAPTLHAPRDSRAEVQADFAPVRRDYLALEAQNQLLGKAGEEYVVELEMNRLRGEGRIDLSECVEHVATTQGDGLGYDVLSFDRAGREKLIEVKTTAFNKYTPFYVTKNEVKRSERDAANYHIYRLFDFRTQPRIYSVRGAISENFELNATTFLARIS